MRRDDVNSPFKWRYQLESGESKQCPYQKFGNGRAYWGENNPPGTTIFLVKRPYFFLKGTSAGEMERNCVYMRAGTDYDKNDAYFAARCDYNENSQIGFVCQSNFKCSDFYKMRKL